MENFYEALQKSTPFVENSFELPKGPGTFKSKLLVRLHFFGRKLFRRK
jgi:hypothetical protein